MPAAPKVTPAPAEPRLTHEELDKLLVSLISVDYHELMPTVDETEKNLLLVDVENLAVWSSVTGDP